MLIYNVRIIFVIIGLATLKRGQTANSSFELEESLISQTKANDQEVNFTMAKIPLMSCCHSEFYYTQFLDSCPEWRDEWVQLHNLPKEMSVLRELVSVYSTHTNQIIEASNQIEVISGSITNCPDGYFGNSTSEFQFFDDGSLRIGEKRLEPKSFCINPIDAGTENLTLVARFCDPDPCSVNGTKCIRKCCPQGMAYNSLIKVCEPYSLPFNTSLLRDVDNVPIDIESFTIHSGLGIKCIFSTEFFVAETNEFFILPDGRMKNLHYMDNDCRPFEFDVRTTENYCVDNYFHEDETRLLGVRCQRDSLPEKPRTAKDIYGAFYLISAVSVVTTLFVYAILPKLQNKHGVTLMCYLSSVAPMMIAYAYITIANETSDELCRPVAIFLHFFYLATFAWLNVVCFDLWTVFGTGTKSKKIESHRKGKNRLGRSFIYYSIYGWGLPMLIVVTGQVLQYVEDETEMCIFITPNFAELSCWFDYRSSYLAYLHGPVGVMILGNIFMFVSASVKFYTKSLETRQATGNKRVFQRFRVIVNLFLITGVTWMLEVINFLVDGTVERWIVIDLVNVLNGFFIFVIFVCKPTVWQMLKPKLMCSPVFSACYQFLMRLFPKNDASRPSVSFISSENSTSIENNTNETSVASSSDSVTTSG